MPASVDRRPTLARRVVVIVAMLTAVWFALFALSPSGVVSYSPSPAVGFTGTDRVVAPVVTSENLRRVEAWWPTRRQSEPGQDTITAAPTDDLSDILEELLLRHGLTTPAQVVAVDGEVAGSSWQLASMLASLDAAGEGDLFTGRKVAATGSLSAAGAVIPVAALDAKVSSAQESGATLLFVPAGQNVKSAPGLTVVEVADTEEAVVWLCRTSDDEICAMSATDQKDENP